MPRSASARRAEAAQETRRALLDAGVRILVRDPAAHVFGHLKAPRVAAEAGRTTGAFFHHWATQQEYVHSLAAYVLEELPSESFEVLAARLAAGISEGATVQEAIVDACRTGLDVAPHDPQTIVELLLWATAPRDQRLGELASAGYDVLDERNREFFETLIALTGRRPRPPFTTRSIGIVVANLGQALALRRAITPEAVPDEAFGWIVLALLPLITTTETDERTADELVDAIAADTLPASEQ